MPEHTWPAMGTFASLRVPATDADRIEESVALVAATLEEIESVLSLYRPDSELGRINRSAGVEPVPVSESTWEILQLARTYAEMTDGAFDPTVTPVLRLWGFSGGTRPPRCPSPEAITEARSRTGWSHLGLGPEGRTAFLDQPGMALDLGGIAKGYAVDVAWQRLAMRGVSNALVNLGGNIRVLGAPAPGVPWRIGVRHPFDPNRTVGTLRLTHGQAVATSGHYERFVDIDGVRYPHIVDPRTGWPVRGMAAVTVVAPRAVDADALSTALFVMGVEEGVRFLRRRPDVHALFVPDRDPLQIVLSPGCRTLFEPTAECAAAIREETGGPAGF